jgi:phage terminase large subunit-like protein
MGMIDALKARAVRRFFGLLKHTKGQFAGKPFLLEAWQEKILVELLATVNGDGLRQYRQAFWAIARKNGKTTLAAGVGLYLLVADGEAAPEVYSAASSRDQAKLVFDQAKAFVEASPVLSRELTVYRNLIASRDGFYRPISADVRRQHGFNASGIVYDELHTALDRELYDVLQTSTGARAQPLMLSISTAGNDRESVCYEVWEYARQVNAGIIDDARFHGFLAAAEPEDDWQDEATWAKANPNLGVSISMEYLQEACKRAMNEPAFLNSFLQLHLNQWVQGSERWLKAGAWDACKVIDGSWKMNAAEAFGGLDLASQHDLAAFVLVFPIDGKYYVKPWFWIPKETMLEKERKDKVSYAAWERGGFLTVTPGNVIDHDVIVKDILALAQVYKIVDIAFDRWGAEGVRSKLTDAGLSLFPMGQGFASMAMPTSELSRLISTGEIVHDGHPVMRWNMDNVVVEVDAAGNMKPAKDKARQKIDGAVALIMALDRAMRHKPTESVYATRGLREV